MNLWDAEALAVAYLEHYGLTDWKFAFNNRFSHAGVCSYSRKTIYLSRSYAALNEEKLVENTILHEIAHALVGVGHGHDWVWRQKALEIGCTGERCTSTESVQAESRYYLICDVCGYKSTRNRKPTRRYACFQCCQKHNNGKFAEKFALKLTVNPKFAMSSQW